MPSTYVTEDAARRLRQGIPWARREEIVSMDGTPRLGEPVELKDLKGAPLGLGDVDLNARYAIRRLGLPQEQAQGIVQRHLRRALEKRTRLVKDPRYCRIVNDDGDGLPGLVVDRFDTHFVLQTSTRAMDARVEEIARLLVELRVAGSILLRNDSLRRRELGLPVTRPHVLHGTPPRWSRVLEMGARLTADLFAGAGTGYPYDHRQVRRAIARICEGARVLDLHCGLGGLLAHAGLNGAKELVGFDDDPDQLDLARENGEANGLSSRLLLEIADVRGALDLVSQVFDVVLLDLPRHLPEGSAAVDLLTSQVRGAVRATRHGGRLVVIGYAPALSGESLDALLAAGCAHQGRVAVRLTRPGLPFDFPTVLGAPLAEYLHAVVVEVS